MPQSRKYEDLLDFDRDAPDVYETPPLTDKTTLPSSTVRTPSQTSSYDGADDGTSDIIRGNINPEDARQVFQSARVDARGVDFSDRIRRRQRSYRTARSRERLGRRSDDHPYADFSDDEDETLEQRLARVRREAEELRRELDLRQSMAGGEHGETTGDSGEQAESREAEKMKEREEDPSKDIDRVCEMLGTIYVQSHGGIRGAEAQFARTLKRFSRPAALASTPASTIPQTTTPAAMPASEPAAQLLSQVAELDARLARMENAVGLNSNNMPDMALDAPRSILQSLDALEHQLETLSKASPSFLDAASQQVQKLTQDVDRLIKRREELRRPSPDGAVPMPMTGDAAYLEDPERVAKINALYGTVSTIESLSPVLGLVVERLRSLNLIHTEASVASSSLCELMQRQDEMDEKIRGWSTAIDNVAESLAQGNATLEGNIATVSGWVKEIEARVAKIL